MYARLLPCKSFSFLQIRIIIVPNTKNVVSLVENTISRKGRSEDVHQGVDKCAKGYNWSGCMYMLAVLQY
jgi:hypothetical protein